VNLVAVSQVSGTAPRAGVGSGLSSTHHFSCVLRKAAEGRRNV